VGSEGVHLGFWCGPSSTHANPGVNHFALSRGEDMLTVRAGTYQNLTPHGSNYYHTSAGMNTLYINGTQELGERSVDLEENSKRYPVGAACEYISGNVPRHRGEIRRFVDRPQYTYVLGDGTYSYRLNGAKLFTRELLFLKAGALVVFDRAVSAGPGDPKRWQLHTYGEPTLGGTVRVVEGTEEAGIIESTDTSALSAVEGDSKLFVVPLLPKDRIVRRIGGEGYHSYIEGKNYHPLDFEGMTGPDWYKELFTNRYRDGLPRSAQAWHIEIEAREPGAEVVFLNVLYPCAKEEAAPPPARLLEQDALAGVELKLGGETVRVLFSTDGKETGSVEIRDADGRAVVDESFPADVQQAPWPAA